MAAPDHDDVDQRRTRASLPSLSAPGPLVNVARPLGRTGRYYAQSWREYLGRNRGELPIARPTIALATHALRDEIVLLGLRALRPLSDPHVCERINREVIAALELYERKGWLDRPEGFFTTPPRLTDVTVREVKGRRRSHDRLVFDSGYAPHRGEPGADRWRSYTANKREYALMLRHPQPRPWLVCVHGAEMGRAALDLTLFRARLWEHWGQPEIVWYQGGHTGFFRSRPVQRFVQEALIQSGLVAQSGTKVEG